MKASVKMMKGIEKVEKRYGAMRKVFGVEFQECCRVGRGFYDYCDLYCDILNKHVIVAHDGSISW